MENIQVEAPTDLVGKFLGYLIMAAGAVFVVFWTIGLASGFLR